jgi:hypothetical protein
MRAWRPEGLTLRPYELLCLVCRLGDERPGDGERLAQAAAAIRETPDLPVTLRCNAGDVYLYQDPGDEADTPDGAEYNLKRDLDVLQRLDLAPGSTLPARTLLIRLLRKVPTVAGLCGYEAATGEAWRGCVRWTSGAYERGHARGVDALIPPRDADEMVRDKVASVEALRRADCLTIRPHVLMCCVCSFGGYDGKREPLAADNIVEFIEVVRERPETPIRLVRGADWMVCAPCPTRVADINACVNVEGSGGLSNEKRDADLLQLLGLTYGATLPARELCQLLFERVPTTVPVCARDNARDSVWWDGCGEANLTAGNPGYEKGRALLMEELARS